MSIDGIIKCRNALVQVNGTMPYSHHVTIRKLMNDSCFPHVSVQSSRCDSEKESIDVCHEWNPCMSPTRISDDFLNCLNSEDETENSTSCDRRHRFRCSAEQQTCLSVMMLGGGTSYCTNQFDEYSSHAGRKLFDMKCREGETSDCSRLRQYIEQSWTSSHTDQMTSSRRLFLRWYCDTFWDLDMAKDENVDECRKWWICKSGQVRCETGQCFYHVWKGDLDWDCADGSDEREREIQSSHPSDTRTSTITEYLRRSIGLDLHCLWCNSIVDLSLHTNVASSSRMSQSKSTRKSSHRLSRRHR
jgi:Low-density lipoprotein receptor domain class A